MNLFFCRTRCPAGALAAQERKGMARKAECGNKSGGRTRRRARRAGGRFGCALEPRLCGAGGLAIVRLWRGAEPAEQPALGRLLAARRRRGGRGGPAELLDPFPPLLERRGPPGRLAGCWRATAGEAPARGFVRPPRQDPLSAAPCTGAL